MMPPNDPRGNTRATAVVLAGGKSSRMGAAKALLPFDDRPLIGHVVALLATLFDDIFVVAAPGQELPAMPVTVVRDEVAYQGPVGGISYGLRAARHEICFVTACDSAFLSPQLIEHLLSRVPEHDVVVPHWQGRFQPLHAVYRRSVLPLLEDQLARGELRPVFLFDKVRTLRVDEDEIRQFDVDGASFFNMNTPEDYAEALRRWGAAVSCIVELYGVPRLLGQRGEIELALPPRSSLADVLAALVTELPSLAGRVIKPDGALVDGYACNVNGLNFVRTTTVAIQSGDRVMLLSADAGG